MRNKNILNKYFKAPIRLYEKDQQNKLEPKKKENSNAHNISTRK
jgi:hypothetical protein